MVEKGIITLIENKLVDILTEATITNADLYVVQGVDKWVKDSDEFSDYPRIAVTVEVGKHITKQSGAVVKNYTANIFLLCSAPDEETLEAQRDYNVERIESALISHQRLDNLADNNKESVFGSSVGEIRLTKFGIEGSYSIIVWIEFLIDTERMI